MFVEQPLSLPGSATKEKAPSIDVATHSLYNYQACEAMILNNRRRKGSIITGESLPPQSLHVVIAHVQNLERMEACKGSLSNLEEEI